MNKEASVIILNWNRRVDTVELLLQLKKQTFKNFETIVVDNASSDDSVSFIGKNFPLVKVIIMSNNLGLYAKNYGLEKAQGEYLILLDSDVLIGSDCIEKFVQKLKSNKDLGMACASVYEAKSKKQLGPNRSIRGDNEKGYKVCFFNGSAAAIKKEVFEKVGGWSRDYFICLEELEWATRILEKGFDIRCFTDIIVYNKKTERGGEYRIKQGYWYSRNWIFFYAQFLPLLEMPIFFMLHLRSFFKKTKKGGEMSKKDCFLGVFSGILGLSRFFLNRRPLGHSTLTRVKADLFPNKAHLYTEI